MLDNNNSFFLIIEKLKVKFLEQLCALIEHQIVSNNLEKNIVILESEKTLQAQEIFKGITITEQIDCVQKKIEHFNNINSALKILHKNHNKNSLNNITTLKKNLFNLNIVFNRLFEEHDLLFRQTEFLKSLINSYADFSDLEQAIQILLKTFYCHFPFYFIAICFEHGAGGHGCQIYYTANFNEEQKNNIKKKSQEYIKKNHGIAFENVEVAEKLFIENNITTNYELLDDNLVSVSFKNNKDFDTSKVLSITCASQNKMTSYERHVMGTNLYIMGINLNTNVHLLSDAFLKVKHYATHDVLTSLYNRRYFDDIIKQHINLAKSNNSTFCVLMIDLDNFKTINDSYGHPIGDKVIHNVATIIAKLIRKSDIACRIGGDEFAVILLDIELNQSMAIADKMRKEIQLISFTSAKGDVFHTSVSIGVASYTNDANNSVDLIGDVDRALYKAKNLGRNTVCSSENSKECINTANYELNYLEKIRIAMNEGRTIPYFQPIVNNLTQEIYAYEVLARIKDTNGTIIVADKFIKLVEKSILSYDFHKIIIYKSLQIFKKNLGQNIKAVRLFINLSVTEIQNKKILEDIYNMCQELEVTPNHITFEFVERDVINDIYSVQSQIEQARVRGFSFALDDFGSAYNSLSYLREMSFEYLKIEGSFVENILYSEKDYTIVKHLQRLCHDLGITVIAEFVESKEILDKIIAVNIPYGQGYYLGMPIDLDL